MEWAKEGGGRIGGWLGSGVEDEQDQTDIEFDQGLNEGRFLGAGLAGGHEPAWRDAERGHGVAELGQAAATAGHQLVRQPARMVRERIDALKEADEEVGGQEAAEIGQVWAHRLERKPTGNARQGHEPIIGQIGQAVQLGMLEVGYRKWWGQWRACQSGVRLSNVSRSQNGLGDGELGPLASHALLKDAAVAKCEGLAHSEPPS
jgi:hypothetical protein